MLRACREVLRPGGLLAGFVIHAPEGLSDAERARARALGPFEILAPAAPIELARQAGFTALDQEDRTAELRRVCAALLAAREARAADLRREEGAAAFEEAQGRKRALLTGIDAGLILRSRLLARRPEGSDPAGGRP